MLLSRMTTVNGDQQLQQHDVVVAMVPLPAQGHLNPLLQLARRLASTHNIPVHFISSSAHVRQAQSRAVGWDPLATPNLKFHEFQITFDAPPPNTDASNKFPSQLFPAFNSSLKLREPVAKLVNNLSSMARKVVVIHDYLTSYVVQDVTKIPNIELYSFITSAAFVVYSYIYDAAKPPVPAEAEVLLKQLPSLEGYCQSPEMDEFINTQIQARIYGVGTIFSTSKVIEELYLGLMEKTYPKGFKQWALGPFNPVEIDRTLGAQKKNTCLEWLDKQPLNSVIFVSFGSTTSLFEEEIKELAIGLERSEQKFIWVLRDADKPDIFDGNVKKYQLPEGYEKRVEERGLVVRDWAPQLEILGHPSTGGFMSHCGWNSCMESISMGVPIATWPMHSDQPKNAVMITEVLKIGISVREWEKRNEGVPAETVEKVVRTLMASPEGEEMRKRANELKEAVKLSVKKDGVTQKEMESFVAHIAG